MHFSVDGDVPETRMSGKPSITVHHQVFQIVTKQSFHQQNAHVIFIFTLTSLQSPLGRENC